MFSAGQHCGGQQGQEFHRHFLSSDSNTEPLHTSLLISLVHTETKQQLFREREINVLINDALNTFYLWLYGVKHMVKDHSDSEKGNPLPPHKLLLSINSKGSFICTIPDRIHLCYTSRGALAGTRNSSMGPPHEGSIRRPIAPWANSLPLSYVPLGSFWKKVCGVGIGLQRYLGYFHLNLYK